MNKILFTTFAIAGALAISGCASLDERLASNDPRVKNEAERELIDLSRDNGDEAMRVAAVKRITNKDYLYEIASNANTAERTVKGRTLNTVKEGLSAIEKLDGEKTFLKLSVGAKSPEVRAAASAKIATDDGFVHLVECSPDATTRQTALDKVTDEKRLAHIVKNASDVAMRLAAYNKIQNQNTLLELLDGATANQNRQIILSGIKRIDEKDKLLKTVFAQMTNPQSQTTKSEPSIVYRKGKHGKLIPISVPGKKKAESNSVETSNISIYDKEIVDSFIANCSNESLLAKVVKEYGEGLSSEQCAAIKTKTKTAEVQNAIAVIADKTILAEIKTFKECVVKSVIQKRYDESMKKLQEEFRENAREDKNYARSELARGKKDLDEWRKEISGKTLNARLNDPDFAALINGSKDYNYKDLLKECLGKFAKIKSVELRTLFVTNEVGRMDRFFAEHVVPCLKDEDVVSLFKAYDDDIYQRELILEYLDNKRIIPLAITLIKNNAPWHIVRGRLASLENILPTDVCKVIDVLPQAASLDDVQVFCDIVSQGSLDESFIGRLKVADVGSGIGNSSNNEVRELVQTVLAKLTPEAKKRMCAAARKKVEAQKGKAVVFGPFYLGMPYLDALLLQEEIWGVDNGVGIWSNFQEKGEHGIYDIASVWKLSFTNKAKFQFIDCKDSLVLPQFIHQFIEGKSGKVSSDFGYVSDIRNEFGTNGDNRLYETYSNTKKGIKVQYCPKDGVLNMVAL